MLLNIVTQHPQMVLAVLVWFGTNQFFARSMAGLASGAAEPYRPGGFFRLGHRLALCSRAAADARQPISICNAPTKA